MTDRAGAGVANLSTNHLKTQERENLDQMQMPVDNAESIHELQENADDNRFETENLRDTARQSNFDEDDSVEEDDQGPEEAIQGNPESVAASNDKPNLDTALEAELADIKLRREMERIGGLDLSRDEGLLDQDAN